ncbi:MAG: hypothetical protein U0R71_01735 [Solirubrobacterales bacterium]
MAVVDGEDRPRHVAAQRRLVGQRLRPVHLLEAAAVAEHPLFAVQLHLLFQPLLGVADVEQALLVHLEGAALGERLVVADGAFGERDHRHQTGAVSARSGAAPEVVEPAHVPRAGDRPDQQRAAGVEHPLIACGIIPGVGTGAACEG